MNKNVQVILAEVVVLLTASLGCSHLWRTDGNSGTAAGTNYLGTNDHEAFEIKVNERRALRIEPRSTPNIIGGHSANSVSSDINGAFIGGGGYAGEPNVISEGGIYASIVGGKGNTVSGNFATMGGGWNNTANGGAAVIAGGHDNRTSGTSTVIGGGYNNLVNGSYGVICGGDNNEATGPRAVIAGGAYNEATGNCAMISGGANNKAEGDYSFAAGRMAKAAHDGSFVWGDHNQKPVSSTSSDQFIARASGGVWFYTDPNSSTGANLPAGSGSWSSVSDRNLKDNFTDVDGDGILANLAEIPIQTWNYKTQDEEIRHIGPLAQDFHAVFGVGEDDRHISSVDADGVALAAIQALYKENQKLRSQVDDLIKRLDALENE